MSKLNLLNKLEEPEKDEPVSKSTQQNKFQSRQDLPHSTYKEMHEESDLTLNIELPTRISNIQQDSSSFQDLTSIELFQKAPMQTSGTDQVVIQIVQNPSSDSPPKVPQMRRRSSSLTKKGKPQKAKSVKKQKYKYKHVPFKWDTYKFLLTYPRRHIYLTIAANFLIIITSLLAVYLPMLMGQLLDSTTKDNDEQSHRRLSTTFFQIMVTLSFLEFFRAFLNQVWQEKIYIDMRKDVLQQFLEFDLNFYRQYRNGEIISRMTNDLQSAKAAVSGNIIMFARNSIMVFINIIVLFILSWKLTFAVLVTMPFFTFSTMIYTRLAKKFEKIGQEQQAALTTVADEIVSGIVTVKSFCGETLEMNKFDKQLKQNLSLAYKRGLNNGVYQFTSTFFIQFGTFVVLWYGGMLVLQNHDLSPGELASFMYYSMQLSNSSSTISEAYSKIVSATGAFEGVLEMLRYQPLVLQNPQARSDVKLNGQIEFKNVYFSYPGTDVMVLKDFTLTVHEGEYVAFVGMSGCGKSTVIQLIERFYDPQHGKILVNNCDIQDLTIKSLRSQIGLVSQEPTLFEGTIESNITYGVQGWTEDDFSWAVKSSGAGQFIADQNSFPNGFKTRVGERGFTLSGGQKQRLAIARALIKKPKILIFDEATSALDAESEFQVQSAIDDLISAENKQTTIIVIAHRLSTIVNCNRICVLSNGAVAEQGTHYQLLEQNGIYKTLVDRQMSGMHEQLVEEQVEIELQ